MNCEKCGIRQAQTRYSGRNLCINCLLSEIAKDYFSASLGLNKMEDQLKEEEEEELEELEETYIYGKDILD